MVESVCQCCEGKKGYEIIIEEDGVQSWTPCEVCKATGLINEINDEDERFEP